jgi:hypothetical protein
MKEIVLEVLKVSKAEIIWRKDTIILCTGTLSLEELPSISTSNLMKLHPTPTTLVIFSSLISSPKITVAPFLKIPYSQIK